MNTDRLARHYDRLTAPERIALLLAARGRGDETERARLLQAAPRRTYRLPHHWGVGDALESLSKFHFLQLLELAAAYLESYATAAAQSPQRGSDLLEPWREVLMAGYLFQCYWTGWRQFCVELPIEPAALWEGLPGWGTVQRAERWSGRNPQTGQPGVAYVEAGAARYLARQIEGDTETNGQASGPPARPVTAEDIAEALRTAWKEQLRRWA